MRPRPRIRPVGVILAILVTLILAAPAAAASKWTAFSQAGTNAFADTFECVENPDGSETCENQSLNVFAGTMKSSGERTRKGELVCYGENSYTYDPETGELLDEEGVFGCTFDAGTLTINRLTLITLAPTLIELVAWECDEFDCTETPAGSTTVFGTWTGLGSVTSQKGRSTWDDGSCVEVFGDRAQYREALFAGSFDAQNAQISKGRFTLRTTCTFAE